MSSGCLAMFPGEPPDSLKRRSTSAFRFSPARRREGSTRLLQDAHAGALKPIYNFLDNLPHLQGATLPSLPPIA